MSRVTQSLVSPTNIVSGWETAVTLSAYMIKYIVCELAILSPSGRVSEVAPEDIDLAIRNAFLKLDHDIMDQAARAASGSAFLNNAMSQLGPAYSGSCALVSYYHSDSQQLKVACTGDSRAVLGRRSSVGKWEATALSKDQTGKDEEEVIRLQAEHPNEPGMIKDGRLLGLAVTRAFGDSRWKWSRELQQQAKKRFFGPDIIEPLLTPPYLTAEPVITTTIIEPEKGDFVIMASDGLWDNLTSEQAVDLVGRWLKTHDPATEIKPPNLTQAPAAMAEQQISARENPQGRIAYAEIPPGDDDNFVVADENAATHLVRNALGGSNEDMLCGLLTPMPPLSRKVR